MLSLEQLIVAARDLAETHLPRGGGVPTVIVGYGPDGKIYIPIDMEHGEARRSISAESVRRVLQENGCYAYSMALLGTADMGEGEFDCLMTYVETPTLALSVAYRITQDSNDLGLKLEKIDFDGQPMERPFSGLLGREAANLEQGGG